MNARNLSLVAASCFLLLAARFAQGPPRVGADDPQHLQADAVPEKYRETLNKGLEYLVQQQFKDGHWEGDGGNHPVAMTGLAGIALLMERIVPQVRMSLVPVRDAKHAANVRKAADWLMEKAQANRDGLIFSEHASETSRYMQGHGLATIFLAGACSAESDVKRRKKLTDVLSRAVKYIASAQSTQGGWYDTSRVEGHDFDSIPPTVIQIQALQAAEKAGIPAPDGALRDGQRYLRRALAKHATGEKANQDRDRPAHTAAALAGLIEGGRFLTIERFTGDPPSDEWRKKPTEYCDSEFPVVGKIKFGRDDLAHYYYAQVKFDLGGENWKSYRTALFDQVQANQNKDGSWPASDGICVGPTYATALWCTVLQLDRKSHPARGPELDEVTVITNGLISVPDIRFARKPGSQAEAVRS